MKTMYSKIALYLLIGAVIGYGLSAKVKKTNEPDPVDMILEKSKKTMKDAGVVSAKVDKVVVTEIKEMKETIEVLEVQNTQLVQQVNVMKNEIHTIKSAPKQPFNVFAILPDSAGGGE
jgi:ABC-type phosphate transport system auxiliary subunit